jgi:hypothetical protein
MNKLKKKTWKDVENFCRKNNISSQDASTIVWCEAMKKEIKRTELELQVKWAQERKLTKKERCPHN